MKIERRYCYPNNISKRRLYETFLSCNDFYCTPEEYDNEIEWYRLEEVRQEENCYWYEDEDGRSIVANLALKDPTLRLEITKDGFRKIPSISKRSKLAL